MIRFTTLIIAVFLIPAAVYAQPRPLWSYEGNGSPAFPPLLTNLTDERGIESIHLHEQNASFTCIDASGIPLWESSIPDNKSFSTMIAQTGLFQVRDALIAVGGDIDAAVFYASTGEMYWREAVGPFIDGGLIWIDLDNDNNEELIAASTENALYVYSYDGQALWTYSDKEHGTPLSKLSGIAAADLDNRPMNEIVLGLENSILAIDSKGMMLWETSIQQTAPYSMVVADTDNNLFNEVYTLTQNPQGILSLDGDLGTERWFFELNTEKYSLAPGDSELITADLNQDGILEIIISDMAGNILVLDSSGKEKWGFKTESGQKLQIAAVDIDGDMQVEILAAASDGFLYQIDPFGNIESKNKLTESIIHAPCISDIDRNTTPDIMLVDNKGMAHSFQTDNNLIPQLVTWPMSRGSHTRSGSSEKLVTWKTDENISLIGNSDFEYTCITDKPCGWQSEKNNSGIWMISNENAKTGSNSLKALENCTLEYNAAIPTGLTRFNCNLAVMNPGKSEVFINWLDIKGSVLEKNQLKILESSNNWKNFSLNSTNAPEESVALKLELQSKPENDLPVYWDSIQLIGNVEQVPVVEILYNQLGYDTYSPKKFVVRSNWKANDARFLVINSSGQTVFDKELTWGIRFKGGGDTEWPGYYWRGDFEEMYEDGSMQIIVMLDSYTLYSPAFDVSWHSNWDKSIPLMLKGLKQTKCGTDNKSVWNFYPENNLDTSPEIFWKLAQALNVAGWRFDKFDSDSDGINDLIDILLPIAESFAESINSNPELNTAGLSAICSNAYNGDNRFNKLDSAFSAAGLSELLLSLEEAEPAYISAAQKVLNNSTSRSNKDYMLFCTSMNLFLKTDQKEYVQPTHEMSPQLDDKDLAAFLSSTDIKDTVPWEAIENIIRYDTTFSDGSESFIIAHEATIVMDEIIRRAKNPFGVYMYKEDESLFMMPSINDIEDPWKAHTLHILSAANYVIQGYRYHAKPEYRDFVYNQLNWLMGCNPLGRCLLTGTGNRVAPLYYYDDSDKLEDMPVGMFPRGPYAAGPGYDYPEMNMDTSGSPETASNLIDLYNTALYINTLAHLKRLPIGLDDK